MPFSCRGERMMKKGSNVKLEMKTVLHMDEVLDTRVHICKVLEYDKSREILYLVLQNEELPAISLDAVFVCTIEGKETISCEGRIKARYRNENGNILEYKIKNGFYKINLNCVDKQEV